MLRTTSSRQLLAAFALRSPGAAASSHRAPTGTALQPRLLPPYSRYRGEVAGESWSLRADGPWWLEIPVGQRQRPEHLPPHSGGFPLAPTTRWLAVAQEHKGARTSPRIRARLCSCNWCDRRAQVGCECASNGTGTVWAGNRKTLPAHTTSSSYRYRCEVR